MAFAIGKGSTKLKRTFSLATLLIFLSVAALVFAVIDYFSVSKQYQRRQDVANLRYLLSTEINPGDSIRDVTSLLGDGERDTDASYLSMMLRWQASARFNPASCPDGVQEGDLFIHYGAKPKPAYPLQFRDGRLVNHDPSWYVGPDLTISALSK